MTSNRPLDQEYRWDEAGRSHALRLVWVPGTGDASYEFGHGHRKSIRVKGFFMSATPVTQRLWTQVMGDHPSVKSAPECPVENVSWNDLCRSDGFLDRANASILPTLVHVPATFRFRLPTETEWEYAARGGPSWRDQYAFSGSNDPDQVAWYGPRWSRARQAVVRVLGPRLGWRLAGRWPRSRRATETHDVGLKAPNQLGLYDMSGNVWEWCQDVCTDELDAVPADGRPYLGAGDERRLRGGCHHNWDLHCRVFWRYGIAADFHDGCIGFRLALGEPV